MVDFMQQGIQPYQPRQQGNNMLALLIQLKQLKQAESDRAYNRQREAESDAIAKARLELARADDQRAQERFLQEQIDIPLMRKERESKIKMQEAQAKAYETLSGISQANVQRVDQATDPSQVADLFGSVKDTFNSNSRIVGSIKKSVLDPVAEVLGPAKDALFKKIKTLDPLEKLAWGKGITDENGPMRQHMDDTDLGKGYKAISDSLGDFHSQVDSVPLPSDFALTTGASPEQFVQVADETVSTLDAMADFISSEPAWIQGENAGQAQKTLNTIASKRDQYLSLKGSIERVSRVSSPSDQYHNFQEDANQVYRTFQRKKVLTGPIEQAFGAVMSYRDGGSLPSEMVADITGQAVESSPEALFRLATFMEEAERNLEGPIFNQLHDALAANQMRFQLVEKARGFSEMTEGVAARESNQFGVYIQEVFDKSHASLQQHRAETDRRAKDAGVNGEQVSLTVPEANLAMTTRAAIQADKRFRSWVGWDNLNTKDRREMEILYSAYYFHELAMPGVTEEGARAETLAKLRDKIGPSFLAVQQGYKRGPTIRNSLFPPSYLAKYEYGLQNFDPELANRISRAQWIAEHPGLNPDSYSATPTFWYELKRDGTQVRRLGYVATDKNGDVVKKNGEASTWYPDFSVAAMYKTAEGNEKLTKQLDDYFGVTNFRTKRIGELRNRSGRLTAQMHEADRLINSFNSADQAKGRDLKRKLLEESKTIGSSLLEFQQVSSPGLIDMMGGGSDLPPSSELIEGFQ